MLRKPDIQSVGDLRSMKSITKDELASKMGSGSIVVVNVLKREAFDKIHIRGSISIPRIDLEEGRWEELDKGREVAVHCSSYECGASRLAADFLESKGFDVKAYEGGMKEWCEAGLPVEGTISAQQFLLEKYGRPATAAANTAT